MPPATTGTYRSLQVEDDRLLLADLDDEYEPVAVTPDESLDADLDPGNVVEAEVTFGSAEACLLSATVKRPTVYEYVPDADVVFEAARDLWQETRADGAGMGSRVTRTTDGDVNGVLYAFADSPAGDRIAEFRSGRRPLDPLLDRVAESEGHGPRAVFVVSPDDPFVIVTIALDPDGLFADTMRETYGLPGAGDLDLESETVAGGGVPDLPDGLGDDALDGLGDDVPDGAGAGSAADDASVETDAFGSVDALSHDASDGGDDREDG